jgi:putative transposase
LALKRIGPPRLIRSVMLVWRIASASAGPSVVRVTFYNERRPHSSLDGRTPDHVYFTSLPPLAAAA